MTSKSASLSNYLKDNYPVRYSSVKARSPLCGVGVNDACYITQPMIDGKRIVCPAYQAWQNMIRRCYKAAEGKVNLAYVGATVCEEWRTFSVFRAWYVENHVDGFELDKDVKHIGNKVYSPSTCTYIPKHLNLFIVSNDAARGDNPIGVAYNKQSKSYKASCRTHGVKTHLGLYADPMEAHEAWLKHKLKLALAMKPELDEIDCALYDNVVALIKSRSPKKEDSLLTGTT